MDHMIKHEETRVRESSREHYAKGGIAVHDALVKHKNNLGSAVKCTLCTDPEGDVSQDDKAALVILEIVCHSMKKDTSFYAVDSMIILSDNVGLHFIFFMNETDCLIFCFYSRILSGTCSANDFHSAS